MMTPDQLIDYTARTESGGQYDAWNPDDNGHGVSFGLIQFNQRKGSLPELLKRMQKADPRHFARCFDMDHIWLTNAVQVRRSTLTGPALTAGFKRAGAHPPFQQVQRDLAREGYLEPAWKIAQSYGLTSERAAAMAFDISVQRGIGWLRRWLKKFLDAPAVGSIHPENMKAILVNLAHDADLGLPGERRTKILRDPALSDAPWSMDTPQARPLLKRGATGPDVKRLQELLNRALALEVDGVFGPRTAYALGDFLARVSPDNHWYVIETTPEVWAALEGEE